MKKTGLDTDSISLEGYVDIEEIINWHKKNNYHHILDRDDHKMMFDVKTRVEYYDIIKYLNNISNFNFIF